ESVGDVGGVETTDDQVFITLRHANGSISNVSYQAGGDRSAPVERVEVNGGGRTAYLDDWDALTLWRGEKSAARRTGGDRGNVASRHAFIEACRAGAWPVP